MSFETITFEEFIMIQTRDWVNPSDGTTSFPLERAYPGHLRGGPSTGIHGIFAVLYHIFKEEDDKVMFVSAYPDLILSQENKQNTREEPTTKIPNMVTFKVVKLTLESGMSGMPGPKSEHRPRYRETVGATDDHVLTTHGQRFASLVQFDCWSNTRFECELLAEYVQEIILKYTGLIKTLGATRVIFRERSEDETLVKFGIPCVSLKYDIGIEKVYVMKTPRIEEIRTRIKV